MCLIVASQDGAIPAKKEIDNAQGHNPDGFGIVYLDKDNRLRTEYDLEPDADIYPLFELVRGYPYVAHFRYATHGSVSRTNAHPFEVIEGQLYVAHNGIIPIDCSQKDNSDTWHFVQTVLKPMGQQATTAAGLEALGVLIGKSNKLAYLDSGGRVSIVNDKEGFWSKGVWFSNSYSLTEHWSVWEDYAEDIPDVNMGPRLTYRDKVECMLCDRLSSHLTLVDDLELDVCDDCVIELLYERDSVHNYSFDEPRHKNAWTDFNSK